MYTPVKQNSTSHFGSNFWECYSIKIKRKVFFYSELEYHNWIMVECNPAIKSFCEQPKKISGYVNDQYKETIFDMWIQWIDGKEEFIEVKYYKEIENIEHKNNRVSKQIRLQKQWCKENDFTYRIVTDKDIRVYPLLSNNKLILSFSKHLDSSNEIIVYKITKLLRKEKLLIKEIIMMLNEFHISDIYVAICSLYVNKKIEMDMSGRNFDENMEVSLVSENI